MRPDIYPDLLLDYNAFLLLSSTRTYGFSSANPISLTEIKSFIDIFGIKGHAEKKTFIKRMRVLDNAFLNWHREKNKDG
jgi:hypothetical protein